MNSFGINPQLEFRYPDHCRIGQKELRKIEKACSSRGISDLIITAKDIWRFKFATSLSVYVLDVSLHIDRREEFIETVAKRLSRKAA